MIRNILLLAFSLISFVCPSKSIASWDCFIKLHKQAISYAISTAPSDIKKSLIAYEDTMLKEVDNIQNTSKPDLISFRSYYKDILEIAKEQDSKRYEYMAKMMTDITIYVFDAYCPIKVSFCDENEIIKQASLTYDGYNPNPDYSVVPKSDLEVRRTLSGDVIKMKPFYNSLVNGIINLWVTIWRDAERDISGLPKEEAKQETSSFSTKETMGYTYKDLTRYETDVEDFFYQYNKNIGKHRSAGDAVASAVKGMEILDNMKLIFHDDKLSFLENCHNLDYYMTQYDDLMKDETTFELILKYIDLRFTFEKICKRH